MGSEGQFRAVAKKYPHKQPPEILADLVAYTPGEEGKWFAAAKSAKLCDEAIALARRTPYSPQTLTRAARDFEEKNPAFAVEAGMAALHWMVEGYGYEITGLVVHSAYWLASEPLRYGLPPALVQPCRTKPRAASPRLKALSTASGFSVALQSSGRLAHTGAAPSGP